MQTAGVLEMAERRVEKRVFKRDDFEYEKEEILERVYPDDDDRVIWSRVDSIISLKKYLGKDRRVKIGDQVSVIGEGAFKDSDVLEVTIPDSVTKIGKEAFAFCGRMESMILPDSVAEIGDGAFGGCRELVEVYIPKTCTKIGKDAFASCTGITVICSEDSAAHRYCEDNRINYVFDFQTQVFGEGIIGGSFTGRTETRTSPFSADEERPFIFVSYSHRDRDMVLHYMTLLYESGWKVWYDEGLTIGDSYDETLEDHVRNCSAFLLFVTENSLNSLYCRENEIPWAVRYGKPIIKCIAEEGPDYDIPEDALAATVSPDEIEPALEQISGLKKGEERVARGISVVVNLTDRGEEGEEGGDGFAYCLYSEENEHIARTILLEAKNRGCHLYDAVREGEDEEKLEECASLIVFLDKAFLADRNLTGILSDLYKAGKDLVVCQVDKIEDEDLPPELAGLHKKQWLNYVFYNRYKYENDHTGDYFYDGSADMNVKLARHLQRRGCRDTTVLRDYEYEKTEQGIVIKGYTGKEEEPEIDSQFNGIPVVRIADRAFSSNLYIRKIVIPDSVKEIGKHAFDGCKFLFSLTIGPGVRKIGEWALAGCECLNEVTIPDGVTEIAEHTFHGCSRLGKVNLPDSLTTIGDGAFYRCKQLRIVNIPDGVTKIGEEAFSFCSDLRKITIPDSVKEIGENAFEHCMVKIQCSEESYTSDYLDRNTSSEL